jgi:hypothetical protein
MGFQIPGPTKGKVDHLIATYGAERVPRPPAAFRDIPESKALIWRGGYRHLRDRKLLFLGGRDGAAQ